MLFTELHLHESVMRGIEEAGFVTCTPVQEATLQKTLNGVDAYVQSQTGTGKTAAFLITIFNLFLTGDKFRHKKALVLTPTRELAVQVEQDAKLLGKYCDIKTGCFYGGVGYTEQDRLLKTELNLFVGTPGRLIDYQKSGDIDFMKFEILVIDEADRMFDMGFIPDIRYMLRRMMPPDRRVTMLFSATLSQRVRHLAWEYMNEPVEVEITPEKVTVDLVVQRLYHIGKDEKFNLLLGLIRTEKPKNALIFTNMKRTAERVSRRLTANGINNDYISGDLPQTKRLQIINAIKAGETEILVATDVAARGLHIEELDIVFNYDLPEDSQNYVHRIGRTARAGKSGTAISLASEEDVYNLEGIETLLGMKIPVFWANDDQIVHNAVRTALHGREPIRARERSRGRRERTETKENRKTMSKGRGDNRRKTGAAQSAADQGGRPKTELAARQGAAPRNEAAVRNDMPASTGMDAARKKRRRRRKGKSEQPAGEMAAARDAGARQQGERAQRPERSSGQSRSSNRDRSGKRQSDSMPRLKKDATPEERLEYYRTKYGDNFEKAGRISGLPEKTKPETLVGSVINMFKKLKDKKKNR